MHQAATGNAESAFQHADTFAAFKRARLSVPSIFPLHHPNACVFFRAPRPNKKSTVDLNRDMEPATQKQTYTMISHLVADGGLLQSKIGPFGTWLFPPKEREPPFTGQCSGEKCIQIPVWCGNEPLVPPFPVL